MTALLDVRSVSKRFGGIVANDRVSISVAAGEVVGLIGPNGSGKTTLFNSIVGQHPVDDGSIHFDGREIASLRMDAIARLGLIRTYQQTRVFRRMTALSNVLVSSPVLDDSMFRRSTRAEHERAADLLAFVGLASKAYLPAGSLSFGQQKLLEFAMALMRNPKLLLLDEPTAGINPTFINSLVDRLRRANEAFGVTLLVIEHNIPVVMALASRIYCLAHGEMLAEGTPDSIRDDPRVIDAYLGAR